MAERKGAGTVTSLSDDADRRRGKARFGRLPERVSPDDMVESQPQPPTPEPGVDPNAQAIHRFGLPL